MNRSARSDFPTPDPPRSNAARRPRATAVPWTSLRASLKHASFKSGWLGCRQPHHKARATASAHACIALAAPRTVLGPQPPAMRDRYLARDIEAEPRVLAEIFLRPVGIEALENALEILVWNAWP